MSHRKSDRRDDRQQGFPRRQAAVRDRAAHAERRQDHLAEGVDCNDHRAIWDALDRVLAKHPDMVLMRGGATKGPEFIAWRRADARKVTQTRLPSPNAARD